MFLKILLLTLFFVALAGGAIALRFFNSKQAPSCSTTGNLGDGDDCPACGVSSIEECTVESKDDYTKKDFFGK